MEQGVCSLCGNEGVGNTGLFLCRAHIGLIRTMFYPDLFTLAQVKDEIRKDREYFISGIENTKKYLVLPESPLTQTETELVVHTLDTVLERLRNTPFRETEI